MMKKQMNTEKKDTFYLAPMLGITDSCFRNAFMKHFGGFDCAIAPFIRTKQGKRFKNSKVLDLQLQRNSLKFHITMTTLLFVESI